MTHIVEVRMRLALEADTPEKATKMATELLQDMKETLGDNYVYEWKDPEYIGLEGEA